MRNMKKAALIALPLCVLLSTQVFAVEWKRDERGWWYQRENGSYPINRWEKMEQNGNTDWYYFDRDGYMVSNAITPDGYTVAGSGEWIIPGEAYMHLPEKYPDKYIVISDVENALADRKEKMLIDCGPYYKIEDMYVIANKEYYLDLSTQSVGTTIILNGDEYKITKYDPDAFAIFQLDCVMDNSGQGTRWNYLSGSDDGNYVLRSYDNDYVYQDILYHGPIYVEKSCVINEVTYNVVGERCRNTVENHFANPYQDGLISATYIHGTFTTDKNGLIAQIDQTYLP